MFARVLQLPGWARPAGSAPLLAERVRCKRISGAYTNAVFFVAVSYTHLTLPTPPYV